MNFEFMLTPETVSLEVGRKIVGLTKNGRRPIAVSFTRPEIGQLIKQPEYLATLYHTLQEMPKYQNEEL